MGNWRQIQARIRKAKNGPEAPAKLADLYGKTRDAMVAFELALLHEKAGENEQCIHWYSLAAERFRRSEWKKKAEEALTRLGAPIPAPSSESAPVEAEPVHLDEPEAAELFTIEPRTATRFEAGETAESGDDATSLEEQVEIAPATASSGTAQSPGGAPTRRRRGRRGGRGRRKKGGAEKASVAPQTAPEKTTPPPAIEINAPRQNSSPFSLDRRSEPREPERILSYQTRTERDAFAAPERQFSRARAGEPALASRLALLESTLRRLVSSPVHQLDEADNAPAGPGVFLLSDSDLTISYYVESCQTLRVALGHLFRGSRIQRNATESLRTRLAEHLGINESKIPDYLKKHCVVRWIQLDEEAPYFAHFVIGVLRTPLNNE